MARWLNCYASKMNYFLVTTALLLAACGGKQPTAWVEAVADEQATLGLQVLPLVASQQAYRLVICAKTSGACRDALQTKDGRKVTFVYDLRAQQLVSDSDTGAVIALKHLPEARAATAKRGHGRQFLPAIPLFVAVIAAGVVLLRLKKHPEKLMLAVTTPGQEVLVHAPAHAPAHASKVWQLYIGGGASAGIVVAMGARQLFEHYFWGYGEHQAAEHWDSIFSAAEHKHATAVKDIDSIVQALAETFELAVTD